MCVPAVLSCVKLSAAASSSLVPRRVSVPQVCRFYQSHSFNRENCPRSKRSDQKLRPCAVPTPCVHLSVGQRSRAWLWRLFWLPPAALTRQTVGGSGCSHRCCDVTGNRKMDCPLCKKTGRALEEWVIVASMTEDVPEQRCDRY